MKISEIEGPRFSQGDLTTFTIDGTELIIPTMKIIHDEKFIDNVCPKKTIQNLSDCPCRFDEEDDPFRNIIVQTWRYFEKVKFFEIATCFFEVRLIEVPIDLIESSVCLNFEKFKQYIFSTLEDIEGEDSRESPDKNIPWPTKENNFLAKVYKKNWLNFIETQGESEEGKDPTPMLFIPISQRFHLVVNFKLQPIRYDDYPNYYTTSQLREFMFEIMEDFVNNLSITYSPETIEKIKALQ